MSLFSRKAKCAHDWEPRKAVRWSYNTRGTASHTKIQWRCKACMQLKITEINGVWTIDDLFGPVRR